MIDLGELLRKIKPTILGWIEGYIDIEKSHKTLIHLTCCRCGRKYILGENAFVTTAEDTTAAIGGYLRITGPRSGHAQLCPDKVGSLNGSLSSCSPEFSLEQEESIRTIARSLRIGETRQWECDRCHIPQRYPEDCCTTVT